MAVPIFSRLALAIMRTHKSNGGESMVRAKFRVNEVRRSTTQRQKKDENNNPVKNESGAQVYETVEIQTIHMTPVYSSDPKSENAKFWDSSPSGKLELGVINLDAAKYFELDKEYYIDFTLA
jgi:hypothetical protein